MSQGRRVLIVEDEALIAFLLEEMIQDLGYQVAGIANSVDAAMAAAPDGYDLAILDVQLAGKHVYPFAETLKARGIPFAFATGNGGSDIPQAHRGAILLHKPFRQESLKIVLDKMSEQRT
jgi:CheY-like chemotaxis protein